VLAALGLLGAVSCARAAPPGTVLQPGTIPVLRGLVSDYRTSATFATAPTTTGNGQSLTIKQLLPKIILDWNSFNIANGSKVEFVQPSTTSAVLNRIYDADPTLIQGQLKANGQVFLLNQNGILFDRGTQIDVNTLVASSLNIDDSVFMKGMASGGLTTPAFSGGYDASGKTIAGAKTGSIVIGANGDANAAAPAISAATGGAIVVIAPIIDNRSGVVTSPDGQVILAAGRTAYLAFPTTSNTTLRGMLVEVAATTEDVNLSSAIRNSGVLTADRGNVTLAGLAINQAGRVSASSATLANGSIFLQARALNNSQRGSVTLAAGSVTETPLDTTDTTTLLQSDDYTNFRSVVTIDGARIDHEGTIRSPAGAVTLNASTAPGDAGTARLYLGPGSVVDASGAWSDASDASNLLTFKVTSNELKNSPDQKTGVLLGAKVTVDLQAGSSLLDLSGYQANQPRTLAQKAAIGGAVTLGSTGDLIVRTDARVDVSGGGVRYAGGPHATTKLLGADGNVYDIGSAPEALRYSALGDTFTQLQPRWGYNQTYAGISTGTGSARPDYVQGATGGSIQVVMAPGAAGLVLDGDLRGGVTVGPYQRTAAPQAGSLSIGVYNPALTAQDFGVGNVEFHPGVQSSLPAGFGPTTALSDERRNQLVLSADLLGGATASATDAYATTGFGSVQVNANGLISIPRGVSLTGPIGGSLALRGNRIEIDGRVELPSGAFEATVLNVPGTALAPTASREVAIGPHATLDTSGEWINDFVDGRPSALPLATQTSTGTPSPNVGGGSIALTAPKVTLASGALLDASAGGSVGSNGAVSGGSGGSISIAASALPGSPSPSNPLTLDATLRAFGFGSGGTLEIDTTSAVSIGANPADGAGLVLDPSFFQAGGFAGYTLSADGPLALAAGTRITPRQASLQLDATRAKLLPSGSPATQAAQTVVLPDDQRQPTSLTLASLDVLTLGTGSEVRADPGAALSFKSARSVSIDGTVESAGGSIAVALSAPDQQPIVPELDLGAHGTLTTAGTFVAKPSDIGRVQGKLWSGGTVTLTAQKAAIDLEPGSTIDVSGARQVIDVANPLGSTAPFAKVAQASNAGALSITGDDAIVLGGALRGAAEATAAGGSFALTSTERGDFGDPTSKRRIDVAQSAAQAGAATGFKDIAISIDKLAGGGFDKLRLTSEDVIAFAANTSLAFQRGIVLDTKRIDVSDGANVQLLAANVKLANSFGERVAASSVNGDPTDPRTIVVPTAPSAPQPTVAGTGTFSAKADTLDLFGSVTISGVTQTRLSATNDLRFSGRTIGNPADTSGASLVGGLTTAGDLGLTAAQLYPTTGSTFTIAVADGLTRVPTPDGLVRIGSSGSTPGDAISAGGSLTIVGDRIVQGGVVKAPLGNLSLQAATSLTLDAGSITSVSASGLTIPYGETQSGVTWTYAATGSDPVTQALSAPPAKHLTLSSPSIRVAGGATVDVSGGGDVQAVEFVPGSGGSNDALIQPNTYAILPSSHLTSAPIDPDLALVKDLGFGSDRAIYNSLHIGPGSAVPAGDYVLLPGYYGLLPGAYIVQLRTDAAFTQMQPGQTATLQNGLTVAAGVLTAAGTSVAASQTVGVVVRPGSDIAKLADYNVTRSSFFSDLAKSSEKPVPRLPADGGQLSLAASEHLELDGTLLASLPTSTARSALVDISATKIAIVDQRGRTDVAPDALQIDAPSLSKLDANLLIGGTRSDTPDGLVVTPTASEVVVANSATTPLQSPELVLAATDSVDIRSGSRIESSGTPPASVQGFSVTGAASGALVRVSNGGLANVTRSGGTSSASGTVTVESDATIASTGSLLLDGTRTTISKGTLTVAPGGALALASGIVSLGETAGVADVTNGLVLDNTQLATLNQLGTLSLRSYSDILLYGHAVLGSTSLHDLTLDGTSLLGMPSASGAAADAAIAGTRVAWRNSNGNLPAGAVGSSTAGLLRVDADTLTIGAGDKAVGGFAGAQLVAKNEIVADGTGSLTVAGPLTLQAARISSNGGAVQAWTAQDAGDAGGAGYRPVTILPGATAVALADSTALGSRLVLAGSSIADAGTIVMKSGSIELQSLGSAAGDGVTLQPGAVLDASGASKDFKGETAIANAGAVRLYAANGTVSVANGAAIRLDAAAAGGDAGSLTLQGAALSVDGTLSAVAANGTGGRASLDADSLANFSALNAKLAAGGFGGGVEARARHGDIEVAQADVVKAHDVVLSADAGTVNVAGRIDASGPLGAGSIQLYGVDVRMQAGSILDASATSTAIDVAADASGKGAVVAPYANGGSVTVVAQGGTLTFADGAVIDVRSGAKGASGAVLLRAPRTSDNGVQADLSGQVLSQRTATSAPADVTVEANRVYAVDDPSGTVDATRIAGYATDNAAFMAAVDPVAIGARLRGDDGSAQGHVHVRPAVEVRASGDLQVVAPWDLTASGWLNSKAGRIEAGSLVVRAAGDLTLSSASIGNPDASLQPGDTWNITLTSGADLTAAKPTQVQSSSALAAQAAAGRAGAGDLVLDSTQGEASVRTGTGEIRIAAGRDFVITPGVNPDTGAPTAGVVFTTGRAAIADPLATDAPETGRFAQGGGNVTITAQRDAVGAGNEWMREWFRSATDEDGLVNGAWWTYRPNFHDGVAALGGGNVTIEAGRNVTNLSAWAPTSALQTGSGASAGLLDFGGGDVTVRAGGSISGGQYLVSRGRARIEAGDSAGTPGAGIQLFSMGVSGDPALQKADVTVAAGKSVEIQSVQNPTILPQLEIDPGSDAEGQPSFNFGQPITILTYAPDSALTVSAKSGGIAIGDKPAAGFALSATAQAQLNRFLASAAGKAIEPAKFSAVAFVGDIVGTGTKGLILFPSDQGALKLLAGGNVQSLNVTVSDSDPTQFSIANAASGMNFAAALDNPVGATNRIVDTQSTDPFVDDVVALGGSITGTTLVFPVRARVWAAQDIVNSPLRLQNLAATDQTQVVADTGSIIAPQAAQTRLVMGGPGALLVQAGGDIDLGKTSLVSTGNQNNAFLADTQGASLTLVAGVTGALDLSKLDPTFKALTDAGTAKDTDAAKAAIDGFLGNAKTGPGNINSYLTSIQSFAGAPINLIAPDGNIKVGLTTPVAGQTIGVVTTAGGAIRSYLSGNFDINRGKVLTAQGGDIVIYSADGSIDAGRGAKTSVTTQPPRRVPRADGGFDFILPIAVQGSGIQTATSKPSGPNSVAPPAGNIFLFAPSGTIDAGEAGITSAGNIVIAALIVLNAENITSVGTAVGVPPPAVGSVASTVAASGATTAANAGSDADAASKAATAAAQAAATTVFRAPILTVEVLGFGEKNCKETDKDCFAK
jgi:filamentous hemagglutinin family protein